MLKLDSTIWNGYVSFTWIYFTFVYLKISENYVNENISVFASLFKELNGKVEEDLVNVVGN